MSREFSTNGGRGGNALAPLGLLFPVAGIVAWLETGDWTWAVYGLLALLVFGAVGATLANVRKGRS